MLQRRPFLRIHAALGALILVFVVQLCMKWIIPMSATTISSVLSQLTNWASNNSSTSIYSDGYRPCIIQLYGDRELRNGTSVTAAGARLSLSMTREFARKQNMAYHLYDCMGLGKCGKAPAIKNACYTQNCTHVLYIDADVLLHDADTDVVRHLAQSYPNAVFMMGIDYYDTMKTPSWHNGKTRLYRTDSNSGMIQFSCNKRLSRRILAEWERLCRSFSPYGSDQEAATLMETLPQYQHMGAFVRDGLMLGQYSVVARHFPGDRGRHKDYPLPNDPSYAKKKSELSDSGFYRWVNAYWKNIQGTEMPATEQWRLTDNKVNGWNWTGPAFQKCPLNQGDYVADLLRSLDLVTVEQSSPDKIKA